MCGRLLAFRSLSVLVRAAPFSGAKPKEISQSRPEAQSASAHRAAKPRPHLIDQYSACRQSPADLLSTPLSEPVSGITINESVFVSISLCRRAVLHERNPRTT